VSHWDYDPPTAEERLAATMRRREMERIASLGFTPYNIRGVYSQDDRKLFMCNACSSLVVVPDIHRTRCIV